MADDVVFRRIRGRLVPIKRKGTLSTGPKYQVVETKADVAGRASTGFIRGLGAGFASATGGLIGLGVSDRMNKKIMASNVGRALGKTGTKIVTTGGKMSAIALGYGMFYSGFNVAAGKARELHLRRKYNRERK